MRACDTLRGSLEDRHRAGWKETVPVWRRPAPERGRAHADTDPYRKQVGTIMTSPARSVSADTRLGVALSLMAGERISSLFVPPPSGAPAFPADTGIITERDVLAGAEHARRGGVLTARSAR